MKIAIITGASAGLGEDYLRLLAADAQYEEIWLIARRAEKLTAFAAEYPGRTIVALPLDLACRASYDALREKLAAIRPDVRLLINCAGRGTLGDFADTPLEPALGVIDLNCAALTALTSLCLPYMAAGGTVLNVCSIAAFAPNTRMAVYCSSKAYVLALSKTLRRELKPRGINVCAACPGPMETEFFDANGVTGRSKALEQTLPHTPPELVAARSLKKALAGRGVYTPRFFFKFYRLLCKLLPSGLIMYLSGT